jgi:hypothetical protein
VLVVSKLELERQKQSEMEMGGVQWTDESMMMTLEPFPIFLR